MSLAPRDDDDDDDEPLLKRSDDESRRRASNNDDDMKNGDNDGETTETSAAPPNPTTSSGGPIHVSAQSLCIAVAPLLGLVWISHEFQLGLENAMLTSLARAAVQLRLLGAVLRPIFTQGLENWWVVLLYTAFMVTLAAVEAAARPQYSFDGMSYCVGAALTTAAAGTGFIVFGLVLRPTPRWHPQYVIPITGMILGNGINSVALSLNSVLKQFAERTPGEIQLYQTFGATPVEAAQRLVAHAIHTGATPWINSMAVIGLISIPGMMTGQILGGTVPTQAAAYQLLISFAIAFATMSAILVQMAIVVQVVLFDATTHIVQTDTMVHKRTQPRQSMVDHVKSAVRWVKRQWTTTVMVRKNPMRNGGVGSDIGLDKDENHKETLQSLRNELLQQRAENATKMAPAQVTTTTTTTNDSSSKQSILLRLTNVSQSFAIHAGESNGDNKNNSPVTPRRRTLFANVSAVIERGQLILIQGNSGTGKSQLLKIIAGLTGAEEGSQIQLRINENKENENDNGDNSQMRTMMQLTDDPELWKQRVRYVSQSKVDLVGTPHDLIDKVSSFASWRRRRRHPSNNMPTAHEMTTQSHQLAWEWGLESRIFDSEWKSLSGGEAQRAYLAIAMASQPSLLLLDESTSALDPTSKQRVEESVVQYVQQNSGQQQQRQPPSVLWVTHDQEQIHRLQQRHGASLWTFEVAPSLSPQVCDPSSAPIEPVAGGVAFLWLFQKLRWWW